MNKGQQIEEQLWNYIDGSATAAEKIVVEKMLAEHEEWKVKYKEQLEIHQLLINETELEQPSLRFTKNVMDGIAGLQPKPATSSYINKYIIRSIAAFFILTISALLIYSFSQADWSASSANSSVIPFDLKSIAIPKYNISKYVNSTSLNITMMVAVVLGLMFFDRLLNSKKKSAA